ncbi:MAG: TIGR00725 family protein [Nocardioidaceae bacterium]
MHVAVAGPSAAEPGLEALAYEVGRLLAEAGCTVVCGGLGGVMEAACRGAKAASGRTIGILPGSSRVDANPFVDVAIATGMGEARNVVIVRTADALVALGGGFGTLSEIGHALRAGKRVVGLGTWEVSIEGRDAGILQASSPEDAVRMLLS